MKFEFDDPLIVAVNVVFDPAARVVEPGETLTETGDVPDVTVIVAEADTEPVIPTVTV